jgi:hypothetical protein
VGENLAFTPIHHDQEVAMSRKKDTGFTDEERAAMKERAKELKAEARMAKSLSEKCQVKQDMSAGQLDKGHPVTGFLTPASTQTAAAS